MVKSGLLIVFCSLSASFAGIMPGSKDLGAIWFIGDSITQSNADGNPKGSPRKSLYDLLTANGYAFTYTGHFTKNVDGLPTSGTTVADNLYHYHSGISGSVIGDNYDRRIGMTQNLSTFWISGRLAEVKPGIVLILLGTNDVGLSYDLPNAPKRLKVLLENLYELPDIGTPTVFLSTMPPNRRNAEDEANVFAFNAFVPGIAADFQSQGRDVRFVDQFTPINSAYKDNMRPDNLHPNAAGNDTMAKQWFGAIAAAVNGPSANSTQAIAFPGEKSDFRGYDSYQFSIGKGPVKVLCPRKASPGNPWIWKGNFWGGRMIPSTQLTVLADIEMLKEGYYIVFAGGDSLGHPSGSERMDAAYQVLTETYGFSKKPALAGLSRECLSIYRWASANPDKVSCIYVDNGVCTLKSWPGGKLVPGSDSKGSGNAKQWTAAKNSYQFASDEEALAYKGNPIDLLEPLAKAKVPLLHVCGSADEAVPYEENDAIMKERYEKLGGSIEGIVKEGQGHHPHGLEDPTPIIEFIKRNTTTHEPSLTK